MDWSVKLLRLDRLCTATFRQQRQPLISRDGVKPSTSSFADCPAGFTISVCLDTLLHVHNKVAMVSDRTSCKCLGEEVSAYFRF
jgi:hypothetical protein